MIKTIKNDKKNKNFTPEPQLSRPGIPNDSRQGCLGRCLRLCADFIVMVFITGFKFKSKMKDFHVF